MSAPAATAIVVPGSGAFGRDGAYRLTARCRQLVQEAERLAAHLPAQLVVFSGWSPDGGPSEAAQMRALWQGHAAELVLEETAKTTAQNASRTLPLLLERGVRLAVVVCAPLHLRRTRYFFGRIYGALGIETRFLAPDLPVFAGGFVRELVALSLRRAALRQVRGEVAALRSPK